jgi:hypothetical protein
MHASRWTRRVVSVRVPHAGVLAAIAALTLGVASAQADTAPMIVSPNWSGYVAQGQPGTTVNYSSATGTWTVPPAFCTGLGAAGGSSVALVGIGGYKTQSMDEVGTDSNCSAKGKPIYYAWFEIQPWISYNVFPTPPDQLQAGDTVTGTVSIVSLTAVRLQVQNQTEGWTWSRDITLNAPANPSAEWIVEAPADCVHWTCHQANLANFGSMTMRNLSAVGNGSTGNLNDPDWQVTPIQLVPSKLNIPTLDPELPTPPKGRASSPAGATPGPVSADGSQFDLNWVAVANTGV